MGHNYYIWKEFEPLFYILLGYNQFFHKGQIRFSNIFRADFITGFYISYWYRQ